MPASSKTHRAAFLQTFHTAVKDADRLTTPVESTEQAAVEFVKPQAKATFAQPAPASATFVEVKGWKVRTGPGFATEPQAKWMISIAHRPAITDAMRQSLRERLEQGFARSAASQFITKYKDVPTAAADAAMQEAIAPGPGTTPAKFTASAAPVVPDGYYAIQLPSQDKPHFYRIKAGRKAGIVFIDQQVSDDRFPIRSRGLREEILAEIGKDVEKAGRAYADLLGRCRRCRRTLTDHNNPYFASGLGPECGSK